MNKTAICGLRAALVIVFLLILLALGALILVGNYFYTFALDPNAKGGFGSAAGIVDSEYTRWLLKDSRDVSLISDDGLELHAYRVDGSVPHRYAVLCHGYQNNATGMAPMANICLIWATRCCSPTPEGTERARETTSGWGGRSAGMWSGGVNS